MIKNWGNCYDGLQDHLSGVALKRGAFVSIVNACFFISNATLEVITQIHVLKIIINRNLRLS